MKKSLFAMTLSALLLGAFALPAISADAPADMVIKMPSGTPTKEPVAFSHKGHGALDCKACHHTWDGKAKVTGCADAGCHNNFDPKNKTEKDSYYMAFHEAKSQHSCVGCHKAMKKEQKKTGPTSCTECHPKKG